MHTIRLRGPWETERAQNELVRYRRRFHRPTGLSNERVWLVVDEAASVVATAGGLSASINGQPLDLASGRCDVTELLTPGNLLEVTGPPGADTGLLARLEIG